MDGTLQRVCGWCKQIWNAFGNGFVRCRANRIILVAYAVSSTLKEEDIENIPYPQESR